MPWVRVHHCGPTSERTGEVRHQGPRSSSIRLVAGLPVRHLSTVVDHSTTERSLVLWSAHRRGQRTGRRPAEQSWFPRRADRRHSTPRSADRKNRRPGSGRRFRPWPPVGGRARFARRLSRERSRRSLPFKEGRGDGPAIARWVSRTANGSGAGAHRTWPRGTTTGWYFCRPLSVGRGAGAWPALPASGRRPVRCGCAPP